jgi:hypothetical protein
MKAVKIAMFVAVTLVGAVLLLRLVYATDLGRWIADAIPDAVWRRFDEWYGRGDGEAGQDGELVAFATLSLIVSTLVVGLVALIVFRRGSGERP